MSTASSSNSSSSVSKREKRAKSLLFLQEQIRQQLEDEAAERGEAIIISAEMIQVRFRDKTLVGQADVSVFCSFHSFSRVCANW
jgi:tRNA nucleotidyltransferase (CCA-adding enzyme)